MWSSLNNIRTSSHSVGEPEIQNVVDNNHTLLVYFNFRFLHFIDCTSKEHMRKTFFVHLAQIGWICWLLSIFIYFNCSFRCFHLHHRFIVVVVHNNSFFCPPLFGGGESGVPVICFSWFYVLYVNLVTDGFYILAKNAILKPVLHFGLIN